MTNKDAISNLEDMKSYITSQEQLDSINLAIKALEQTEVEGDLISREALKKELSGKEYITWTHEYGDAIPVEWVMSAIDNAPTVNTSFCKDCEWNYEDICTCEGIKPCEVKGAENDSTSD